MMNLAYDESGTKQKFELIGGETIMLARPATNHGEVAGNIHRIFSVYLRGKRCKVYMEPDVHLDEKNWLIPDIAIVCNRDIIKKDGIYGAPDLVAEVLSPGTARYDRGAKKDAYETFGVKEYWLVDTETKAIEVYHRYDRFRLDNIYRIFPPGEWELLTAAEKASQQLKVKVSLYDDLLVDIKEVFEDMTEWPQNF